MKQVFTRLRTELPEGLARLDAELDWIVTAYLDAAGIPYRRVEGGLKIPPSPLLPEDWREGGVAGIGSGADTLHPGHPLVTAAIEEARASASGRLCVAWKLTPQAPASLNGRTSTRGRLALDRVRYEGFERVDRLVAAAVLDGETDPLDTECGQWLLTQSPRDVTNAAPPLDLEEALADAMEQEIFVDQTGVARDEQQSFNRQMEQIERYVEDQVFVLRRRISAATVTLTAAEEKRDAALGSDARDQANARIRAAQEEIDKLEAEVARLEKRDDPAFQKWRDRAHQKRFRPPGIVRVLDVEFILE